MPGASLAIDSDAPEPVSEIRIGVFIQVGGVGACCGGGGWQLLADGQAHLGLKRRLRARFWVLVVIRGWHGCGWRMEKPRSLAAALSFALFLYRCRALRAVWGVCRGVCLCRRAFWRVTCAGASRCGYAVSEC